MTTAAMITCIDLSFLFNSTGTGWSISLSLECQTKNPRALMTNCDSQGVRSTDVVGTRRLEAA